MTTHSTRHEDVNGAETVTVGSDRNFGLVFTMVCAVVALAQLWFGNTAFWGWLIAAGVFAALTLVYSRALRPLNILWFKFGMLLHLILSPVVLGVMFYAVFTPIGWCMRLAGKRPLSLRFEPKAQSYWVHRRPPGPPPGSFNQQF